MPCCANVSRSRSVLKRETASTSAARPNGSSARRRSPAFPMSTARPPLRHLRWIIGGVLFLSTVVNYIDRQTLSVLGPYIKKEYAWSNADFAWLIIAFRVAYSIGQTAAGRLLDR